MWLTGLGLCTEADGDGPDGLAGSGVLAPEARGVNVVAPFAWLTPGVEPAEGCTCGVVAPEAEECGVKVVPDEGVWPALPAEEPPVV